MAQIPRGRHRADPRQHRKLAAPRVRIPYRLGRFTRSRLRKPAKSREFAARNERLATADDLLRLGIDVGPFL